MSTSKINHPTFDTLPQFVSLLLEKVQNMCERLNALENAIKNQGGSEEILNVNSASKFLGLSKPTVYRLCCGRALPHSKRGGKLFFIKSELENWIKNGKRNVT